MHRRALVCVAFAAACASPPPAPPTAVIDAMPRSICEGDAFATPIAISGARSSARLSLVPAPPDPDAPPLRYAWHIEGAQHKLVDGALDEPDLTVVTAGDAPLHVTLTVTDIDGGEAVTLRTIGIVSRDPQPCTLLGCDEGSTCVERSGEAMCIGDMPCETDDDCGCLVCDLEIARCVP